mgnify:CR=1 FL=1|tara:strand:- start:1465 stop:1869 length:405 start_codon:yes stop_codon:yes gene_type:complete
MQKKILILLFLFFSCSDIGDTALNSEPIDNIDYDCNLGNSSQCVSYANDIQNIFDTYCTYCHGNSGGLSLENFNDLMLGGNSGQTIIPGNGEESLLTKILKGEVTPQMPLDNCCIDSELIILIQEWIDQGALNN